MIVDYNGRYELVSAFHAHTQHIKITHPHFTMVSKLVTCTFSTIPFAPDLYPVLYSANWDNTLLQWLNMQTTMSMIIIIYMYKRHCNLLIFSIDEVEYGQ